MSQIILETGRKTSQQEGWYMPEYSIHVNEATTVTGMSLQRNVWQDQAQTTQSRQWLAKNIQQFSDFKITTLWNKISHKDCILGHRDSACRECFIQIWYLLKFLCTHLVCTPLRQLESIKVTWLGDDSPHTCDWVTHSNHDNCTTAPTRSSALLCEFYFQAWTFPAVQVSPFFRSVCVVSLPSEHWCSHSLHKKFSLLIIQGLLKLVTVCPSVFAGSGSSPQRVLKIYIYMFTEITIIYLECKYMVTDDITGKYFNGLH